MDEEIWYYAKDNKQMGPIPKSELQELFRAGHLAPDTPIWSQSLKNWTPASETEFFRLRAVPAPPPLPGQKVPPTTFPEHKQEVRDQGISQVRPWVRYWARSVDMWIGAIAIGLVLTFTAPGVLRIHNVLLTMLISFVWVFIEALFLSTWGTTPAKWLLKITLRDSRGYKLTFSGALSRSVSVWCGGIGLGFPIASIVTLIISYRKLTREGITRWDRDGGFAVSHGRISTLRVVMTGLIVSSFLALIAFGWRTE